MKKMLTILTVLLISMSALQAQSFAKKGTFEIGGNVGFFSSSNVINGETGDATNTLSFSSFTGYFITDGFEIGFAPLSYSVTTPANGDKITNLSILFAPAYNFDLGSNIFPFIEGLVGYTSNSMGDNTSDGISWGARGGIKLVVGQNALINVGIQYTNYNYNPEGAEERNGSNNISANAGFAVFF
ncbi:outer membrane beta-barrel protein [Bacteroidota bacterium]